MNPMDVPAAEAAKLVKRLVLETGADGKPTGKTVEADIKADEVFACRVHGDTIVVVTTDGKKLTGRAPKGKA